jgi:hypothetical protein
MSLIFFPPSLSGSSSYKGIGNAEFQSLKPNLIFLDVQMPALVRWIRIIGKKLLSYKAITDERFEPDLWTAITATNGSTAIGKSCRPAKLRREKLALFLSKRIDVNHQPREARQQSQTYSATRPSKNIRVTRGKVALHLAVMW